MTFIDINGTVFNILASVTATTGSLFITLLLVVVLFMVVAAMLRLPMELTAIFVMPLLLVLMAYDATFFAAGGTMLIYLGVLLAKNFFGFSS